MKKILLFILFIGLLTGQLFSQEITFLGTKSISSSNFPTVSSFFATSYTQCIYKSTEISMDTIFGLEYQIQSGSLAGADQWEIYLGETTQNNYELTGPNLYNDFVTGITKVYDGIVSLNGTRITIFFDTPFVRTAMTNLIISVNETSAGTGGPRYWYTSLTNNVSDNLCMAAYGGTINPFSPPGGTDRKAHNGRTLDGFFRPYTGFITSPKCEVPTDITFSDITPNSAKINFDGKNGTSWQVNKVLTGEYNNSQDLSDTTDTLTTLPRNSLLEIKVRANCGVGGLSKFSPIENLRTLVCDGPPVAGVSEDFENSELLTNTCWSSIGAVSTNNQAAFSISGTKSIRFGGNTNAYLVLPQLKKIKNGSLKFSIRGGTFTIGTMQNNYDASTFTTFTTSGAPTNSWVEDSVDFSTYNGSDQFIAIRMKSFAAFIEDVSFLNPDTIISETICFGDTYTINNSSFSHSGTFTETINTATGDSTVQLNLTVLPEIRDTVKVNVCESYINPSGNTLTSSGIYSDTLTNLNGCDSIIVTDLKISLPDLSSIDLSNREICNEEEVCIPLPSLNEGDTYTLYNKATGIKLSEISKGVGFIVSSGKTLPGIGNFALTSKSLDSNTTLQIHTSSKVDSFLTGGVKFDGQNDQLNLPISTNFQYEFGYAFEAWLKSPTPNNTKHDAIFSLGTETKSDVEVYVQKTSNLLTIVYNRENGGGIKVLRYPTPPNDEWYHLAITHSSSNQITQVYYNGVLQTPTEASPAHNITRTPGSFVTIGDVNGNLFNGISNSTFNGSMDEVKIWRKTISSTQVVGHMNSALKTIDPFLGHYFQLEETSGTTAYDQVTQTDMNFVNTTAPNWINGVEINCPSTCMATSFPEIIVEVTQLSDTIYQDGNTLKVTANADSYKWYDCQPSVLAKNSGNLIAGETNSSLDPAASGEYKAEITKGICVKETDCYAFWLNSLNTLPEGAITISPNPAQEQLLIQTDYKIQKSEVYNTSGVMVAEFENENSMDISSLEQGIYNVRVYTPFGVTFQKIIKE